MQHIFFTKKGIFAVGLFIGIAAAALQKLGNPANMGICVACFLRDIAGALGFHRAVFRKAALARFLDCSAGVCSLSFWEKYPL